MMTHSKITSYNEIMMIEDEMKFATVNSNIAEINNIVMNSL